MPPRLAPGGVPVGQHIQRVPLTMELCECWDCLESPGNDPVTNLPITGRYVSQVELKHHRHKAALRNTASAALASSTVSLDPPPLNLPTSPSAAFPMTFNPPPAAPPVSSLPNTPPDDTERRSFSSVQLPDDQVLNTLHTMQESIARHQKIVSECHDFIFRSPPTAHSLPWEDNEHCELDPDAPTNSVTIGAKQFLSSSSHFIKNHINSKSTHVKLLSKLLLRQVETAISTLNAKLKGEWERQQSVIAEKEKACISVVETGESMCLPFESFIYTLHSDIFCVSLRRVRSYYHCMLYARSISPLILCRLSQSLFLYARCFTSNCGIGSCLIDFLDFRKHCLQHL